MTKQLTFYILLFLLIGCSQSDPSNQPDSTVPDSRYQTRPLLIGESVPDVTLSDINGEEVRLADKISGQPAVLIFYRGGWCPFCSAHLAELAELEDEIYHLGYDLLAISPDQPEYLRQTLEDQEVRYTLLSDSPMDASRAFGIAYREDDETVAGLKENGMDIVLRSGYEHQQLPVPAVFVTDPSGSILFKYVNPDYKERINGEILLAALRSFAE